MPKVLPHCLPHTHCKRNYRCSIEACLMNFQTSTSFQMFSMWIRHAVLARVCHPRRTEKRSLDKSGQCTHVWCGGGRTHASTGLLLLVLLDGVALAMRCKSRRKYVEEITARYGWQAGCDANRKTQPSSKTKLAAESQHSVSEKAFISCV